MKTTSQPPAYPGATDPEIIIGVNLKKDFEHHYKLVRSCNSPEEFLKAISSAQIPDDTRAAIADKYKQLRDSGWYLDGYDKHSRIKWYYQIDSRMTEIMDLGRIDEDGNNIDGVIFSKEECRLARATVHRRMGKSSGSIPKCEPWDYEPTDSGR